MTTRAGRVERVLARRKQALKQVERRQSAGQDVEQEITTLKDRISRQVRRVS